MKDFRRLIVTTLMASAQGYSLHIGSRVSITSIRWRLPAMTENAERDIDQIEISELGYTLRPPAADTSLAATATKVATATASRVATAAATAYATAATNAAAAAVATAATSATKAATAAATTAAIAASEAAGVTAATAAVAASEAAATAATAAGTTAATTATNVAAKAAAAAVAPAASAVAPAVSAATAAASAAVTPAATAAAAAVSPAATAAAAAVAPAATAAAAAVAPAATAAAAAVAPAATAAAAAASTAATAATAASASVTTAATAAMTAATSAATTMAPAVGAVGAAAAAAAALTPAATAALTAATVAAATAATVPGVKEAGTAAISALKPGAFVEDAWAAVLSKMQQRLPVSASSISCADGVFVSALTGAPLFAHAHSAGVGPEGLCAFSVPQAGGDTAARMLQHVHTATDKSAGAVRTELIDLTSGLRIGYALGAPAQPSAGPLDLYDAQLLLVSEASVILLARGEPPPANVPQPAAPAIRRLLARDPEWIGLACVVTLAGGPSGTLCTALSSMPGVLEATCGWTGADGAVGGGQAAYGEACSGEAGLVEAVQLAVEPTVTMEALLDTYLVARAVDAGVPHHAPAIFYHSTAQREAALAWSNARMLGPQREMTVIRPATVFWESGPEHGQYDDEATRDASPSAYRTVHHDDEEAEEFSPSYTDGEATRDASPPAYGR